ncbi:MAG: hypothetical protein AAFR59_20475, partial [Bacteroidota bacterium]
MGGAGDRQSFSCQRGEAGLGYTFYDATAKLNHILSPKDRLYLSFYLGNDRVPFTINEEYEDSLTGDFILADNRLTSAWGNQITALRWNHLWGNRAFSNLTATFSRYRFKAANAYEERRFPPAGSPNPDTEGAWNFDYRAEVEDWGLKWDAEYYPQAQHTIRAGAQLTFHRFQPGSLQFASNFEAVPIDTVFNAVPLDRWEGAFYAEDTWTISQGIQVNAGLHLNGYQLDEEIQ